MGEVFVELKGIKKAYEGVYALKGIDLALRKGEIHCLAGGNGCGKSTLIKTISGVHEPTAGEIYIDGQQMNHMKPLDAIEKGIQVIYQDFAVFPNLTVAENIALNTEIKDRTKVVSYKRMRELAGKAMAQIGADLNPDARLEDLSVAGKQMVALCRAIINNPKLLILDEPTTALTAKEVQKLWGVLRNLREQNIAILLVDHKFDEIRPLVDRLTILRNGEFVSSGLISEYGHVRFQKDMTGHDFSTEKYRPEPSDEPILSVEHISSKGNYEDISFALSKGDVLGITGLLGSGRNEIAEALFGLCPAESGKIVLHGKEVKLKSIKDAVKHEIGFVPEDRLTEGLFTALPITDNTVASSLKKYVRAFGLKSFEMGENTKTWMKRLGVVAVSKDVPVSSLSGGNAQKVVLGKWLNTNPKLLVLVGPSVGMDVGAKAEIHAILRDLAQTGVGVVMVTDDLSELVENCNRILIVKDHKIIKSSDNSLSKKEIEALLMGSDQKEEEA